MNKQTKVVSFAIAKLKAIRRIAIIALFAILIFACSSTPFKWRDLVYRGEDTPMLTDTKWYYDETTDFSIHKATINFDSGGNISIVYSSGSSYTGTWERIGNTVQWTLAKGLVHYTGEYSPETKKITGTAEPSSGDKWTFEMELLPEYTIKGASTSSAIVKAVAAASEEALKNVAKNSRIAIVYITATDRSTTDYITGELEYIWVNKGFIITDRSELERVRREHNFQMSGEVDEATAVSIGKFIGADIIITGRVDGEGDLRRLRIRALNTQTAQVVGNASERF
jgi:hypothetical protein